MSVCGTGAWIASLLPHRRRYAEPFAGMLGVMMCRRPSRLEIANDLSRFIVDWWEAVRDHREELQRRLDATPYSLAVFQQACAMLDSDDAERSVVDTAWAVTITIGQSIQRIPEARPSSFSRHSMAQGGSPAKAWRNMVDLLPLLSDRVSNLELDMRDAAEFTDAMSGDSNTVVYCDPPYIETGRYYKYKFDADEMLEVLRSAKALIAVSGLPGDVWEALEKDGWERRQRAAPKFVLKEEQRTEVLWSNFTPAEQDSLF